MDGAGGSLLLGCGQFNFCSGISPPGRFCLYPLADGLRQCAALLWSVALYTGQWQQLPLSGLWLLLLSGIIGILIGDTALFASMNRLGPRRAGGIICHPCLIFRRAGLSVSG